MTYDRTTTTLISGMRLLPWTNDTGNPCYLRSKDPNSRLHQLADEIEDVQLADSADLFTMTGGLLADDDTEDDALRHALHETRQALARTLRIADSRGARLDDASDELPSPAEESD